MAWLGLGCARALRADFGADFRARWVRTSLNVEKENQHHDRTVGLWENAWPILAQIRPGVGPHRPLLDEICQHLTTIGQISTNASPQRTTFVDMWPILVTIWQNSTKNVNHIRHFSQNLGPASTEIRRALPEFVNHRSRVDQTWSFWAKCWSTTGQFGSKFGRIRPHLVEFAKVGQQLGVWTKGVGASAHQS